MTNREAGPQLALGLIETASLVPAVEAADVGAKTAAVRLVGYELTTGGMVTVKFRGEVAAVRAAVEAGREAASRIGRVVSAHVIPRPHEDTELIVPIPPGRGRPPGGPAGEAAGIETSGSRDRPASRDTRHAGGSKSPPKAGPLALEAAGVRSPGGEPAPQPRGKGKDPAELRKLPVQELRRLARSMEGIGLSGREISHARKDQLLRLIEEAWRRDEGEDKL